MARCALLACACIPLLALLPGCGSGGSSGDSSLPIGTSVVAHVSGPAGVPAQFVAGSIPTGSATSVTPIPALSAMEGSQVTFFVTTPAPATDLFIAVQGQNGYFDIHVPSASRAVRGFAGGRQTTFPSYRITLQAGAGAPGDYGLSLSWRNQDSLGSSVTVPFTLLGAPVQGGGTAGGSTGATTGFPFAGRYTGTWNVVGVNPGGGVFTIRVDNAGHVVGPITQTIGGSVTYAASGSVDSAGHISFMTVASGDTQIHFAGTVSTSGSSLTASGVCSLTVAGSGAGGTDTTLNGAWQTTSVIGTGTTSTSSTGAGTTTSGSMSGTGGGATSGNSGTTTIVEFRTPTGGSVPYGISPGVDGNVWFTENGSGANKIGKITPSGAITEFSVPNPPNLPIQITMGPDGNLWFTENQGNKIGRITPGGAITEFPVPTPNSFPDGIVAGPDHNLWFTENAASKIGRITPSGVVTEFPLPGGTAYPGLITLGSDNNLWFVSGRDLGLTNTGSKFSTPVIGRVTPVGTFTYFPIPDSSNVLGGIAAGPDGNLYFTEYAGDNVGRISLSGAITEFAMPTPGAAGFGITTAPDGNLYFAEFRANRIARLSITGTITEFPIPTPYSGPNEVAVGPDGNIWFTEFSAGQVGKLLLAGGTR